MTKTLTEQWRKHNLKYKQHYYLRTKDGGEDIQPFMGGFFMEESNPVVDVLSSVPSHEEWKRLQEQVKSANNAMKAMLPFAHNYPKERIKKYLEKWGVK